MSFSCLTNCLTTPVYGAYYVVCTTFKYTKAALTILVDEVAQRELRREAEQFSDGAPLREKVDVTVTLPIPYPEA